MQEHNTIVKMAPGWQQCTMYIATMPEKRRKNARTQHNSKNGAWLAN
jgi:hypothetical protein